MAAGALSAAMVGAEAGPLTHAVDARGLMAYAAGLGETDPRYYDTLAPGGPAAHPLFAVVYEWPLALAVRAETVDEALAPLSVHAAHRLAIHRAPRAGDVLLTTARVAAVTPRRAGTLVTVRFTTVDGAGRPVTTTDHASLYRGVPLDGAPGPDPWRRPSPPESAVAWQESLEIAATAAHVYTECARI
ncbi:MAG TPA: MaoC family dehydratase N-terminal domain-containing protein, partial [Methylomirabilota bacterium]|nr:MaoC family dehydratase N-terminal domain-containing protein [Methylomirabilota bacterium]